VNRGCSAFSHYLTPKLEQHHKFSYFSWLFSPEDCLINNCRTGIWQVSGFITEATPDSVFI